MLQLAWVTDSQEYETRAYMGLAKQFFHEQNIIKSQYYLTKALSGELEPYNSRQRVMAIEQFGKYLINDDVHVDKWERLGYKVVRVGIDKTVDSTQDYD